ncbi:unnamed protein product [Brachionus calyciflorus]|uniref:C2H2-type domain-containing protein n=1 Tax=Brachionus calyciflorus TaxID=104777 RepID=A0A814DL02_9BILA|nr:unnamed protein product [Brachionus calyciflorus]
MDRVRDTEEYKNFLKVSEKGLVYSSRKCSNNLCRKFNQDMSIYLKKGQKMQKIICYFGGAPHVVGRKLFDDSFFSLFKKPLKVILAVLKCWSAQITINKTISLIDLNFDETISDDCVMSIFYKLRQISTLSLDKKNLKLGGRGRIVEIDESMYAKVKHWVGKDLSRERIWVFGLVESCSKDCDVDDSKCYLEIVKNREADTLLQIIYEKCLDGTTIYSDCWSSYNKINCFKNFKHRTVNHSVNFIDPSSGVYTNRIESIWNICKSKFKEMRGCSRGMIQSYIDEFVWKFNNKCTTDRKKAYDLISNEISLFYKPDTQASDFESQFNSNKFYENDYYEVEFESDSEVNSDQDSSSVLGSINNEDNSGTDEVDDEIEDDCDDDKVEKSDHDKNNDEDIEESTIQQYSNSESTTIQQYSNSESTTAKNDSEINNSICDVDELEPSEVDNFEIKLSNIKLKANLYETESKTKRLNQVAKEIVGKVLSGKRDPVECNICGKYFEGQRGLKSHITKSHK